MKYKGPHGLWPLGIESGDPFSETAEVFYFPKLNMSWMQKMLNTEDMGITSLVNMLGGSTCDTVSFFQHPC